MEYRVEYRYRFQVEWKTANYFADEKKAIKCMNGIKKRSPWGTEVKVVEFYIKSEN